VSFLHNVNFNILLSYFPGFQCKASCAYLWELYGKKYVSSIYLCMWNHVGIKKILTGCLQNSIEFVSFWLKNLYFPGLLFMLPGLSVGLEWWKCVLFINLCMWYQVGMKKILTGCPKNCIEFVSFWLKITQNYVKIDIMQKRHLF
jgi:hypothetical protein